jgi:tetratricopeptide (TPR) repeat protein
LPLKVLQNMTVEELNAFGSDIDHATGARDVSALEALDIRADTLTTDDTSQLAASVWYFRSNVQSALQDIHDRRSWQWRQPHRERQILYLRRAIKHPTFILLSEVTQASILVNLGNSLSSFGRGLEAIELYDGALALIPNYAMALGNRGEAMYALLSSIPDPGHAHVLAAYAQRDLEGTQAAGANWENGDIRAKSHFKA